MSRQPITLRIWEFLNCYTDALTGGFIVSIKVFRKYSIAANSPATGGPLIP